MLDLDAAVLCRMRNNPPPAWWPVPPPTVGRVWQYHPTAGPSGDCDEERPDPRVRYTDRDILEATYPGDSLIDVARRMGCSGQYISKRRMKSPTLAELMDARTGRQVQPWRGDR